MEALSLGGTEDSLLDKDCVLEIEDIARWSYFMKECMDRFVSIL